MYKLIQTKDEGYGMQEELLLVLCNYSHDYDGFVYEEKSCGCSLYRKGDDYFIRRYFSETWDSEKQTEYTEDIPVQQADLQLGKKKLCAKYCNGRKDNEWIEVYRVHRDADAPGQTPVWQLISK